MVLAIRRLKELTVLFKYHADKVSEGQNRIPQLIRYQYSTKKATARFQPSLITVVMPAFDVTPRERNLFFALTVVLSLNTVAIFGALTFCALAFHK